MNYLRKKYNQFFNIKALFPATVEVTQEMIDDADVFNANHCIGAKSLRKVLPFTFEQYWMNSYGMANKYTNYRIESYDTDGNPISMMRITEPTTVILKIAKNAT